LSILANEAVGRRELLSKATDEDDAQSAESQPALCPQDVTLADDGDDGDDDDDTGSSYEPAASSIISPSEVPWSSPEQLALPTPRTSADILDTYFNGGTQIQNSNVTRALCLDLYIHNPQDYVVASDIGHLHEKVEVSKAEKPIFEFYLRYGGYWVNPHNPKT
jgi:hypothetical protein